MGLAVCPSCLCPSPSSCTAIASFPKPFALPTHFPGRQGQGRMEGRRKVLCHHCCLPAHPYYFPLPSCAISSLHTSSSLFPLLCLSPASLLFLCPSLLPLLLLHSWLPTLSSLSSLSPTPTFSLFHTTHIPSLSLYFLSHTCSMGTGKRKEGGGGRIRAGTDQGDWKGDREDLLCLPLLQEKEKEFPAICVLFYSVEHLIGGWFRSFVWSIFRLHLGRGRTGLIPVQGEGQTGLIFFVFLFPSMKPSLLPYYPLPPTFYILSCVCVFYYKALCIAFTV